MKKTFLIILYIFSSQVFAQWDVSASMGLDFKSTPSFRDYINVNFARGSEQLSSFKSAISFDIEGDYKTSTNFALGIDCNLQYDSYSTLVGVAGLYEISYSIYRPSIMAYYLLPGQGYQFKFGGGIGYRYAKLEEKIFTSAEYTASGAGLILKAEGNTYLSKNFYALIGGNFRMDYIGEVSNGSNKIKNNSTGENLNLNSISFGVYLGLTFTF